VAAGNMIYPTAGKLAMVIEAINVFFLIKNFWPAMGDI
jgi:hypothetical protein